MKTLHIIIHPECTDEKYKQDKRVLERLKELKESKPVMIISAYDGGLPFETFENSPCGEIDKERIRKTVEGYDLVILYGVRRNCCLEYASKAIFNEGIPVAFDIKGTA